MRIYSDKNVFDAALDRLRWIYDEFPEVLCSWSGGKDSTVLLHMTLQVARERGRLPLNVLWIDQEVEWQGTVDLAEQVMTMPDVKPYWMQMPMVITNNANSVERYNHCWDPKDECKWTHPKHPVSIKENRYGTQRFHDLFSAIERVEFGHTRLANLGGVRTSEAPKRLVALTNKAKYKWATWGAEHDKRRGHYTFYPIYDWGFRDVWKAIHDHKWPYNRVYDAMFQHGVKTNDMRISNLHHETAVQVLTLIQEIEPETWVRVADRILGANTVKHLKRGAFACPDELPPMFSSWREYAMHLADNMVPDPKSRKALESKMSKMGAIYVDEPVSTMFWQTVVTTILTADWDFTHLINFTAIGQVVSYTRWKRGVVKHDMLLNPALLPQRAIHELKQKLVGVPK